MKAKQMIEFQKIIFWRKEKLGPGMWKYVSDNGEKNLVVMDGEPLKLKFGVPGGKSVETYFPDFILNEEKDEWYFIVEKDKISASFYRKGPNRGRWEPFDDRIKPYQFKTYYPHSDDDEKEEKGYIW